MNVLDAAYNVVHDQPGGASPLSVRLGKGQHVLGAELAARGHAKLGLVDAVKISQMTGDLRILFAFAEECGQLCVPLPQAADVGADDVLRALAEASREFAELCTEVCRSMADGQITDTEMDRFERERGELMAGLHLLGERMRAVNQSSKAQAGGSR